MGSQNTFVSSTTAITAINNSSVNSKTNIVGQSQSVFTPYSMHPNSDASSMDLDPAKHQLHSLRNKILNSTVKGDSNNNENSDVNSNVSSETKATLPYSVMTPSVSTQGSYTQIPLHSQSSINHNIMASAVLQERLGNHQVHQLQQQQKLQQLQLQQQKQQFASHLHQQIRFQHQQHHFKQGGLRKPFLPEQILRLGNGVQVSNVLTHNAVTFNSALSPYAFMNPRTPMIPNHPSLNRFTTAGVNGTMGLVNLGQQSSHMATHGHFNTG